MVAVADEGRKTFAELQTTGAVRNHKCRIQGKDAAIHDTLISLEPVALGEEDCLLLAMHDVTEQVQLEARLRQSQKMEAIGQLAAGVAHDFNNLLTIINGHASLQMSRVGLDNQVIHSLNQVKLAADRAAGLTKQLLAFSRKQLVKRIPLDLADVVARTQPMLSRMVGETITLENHCPADLPPVLADEHSVDQILMNLVVNARDATPAGGKIRIALAYMEVVAATHNHPDARDGHFVQLSVEDTGSGIETSHLNRLFEPFFTTKPQGKGTGLGLSTVFGIAQQHEGWVEVKSKRGVGSAFTVFLPVSEKPAAKKEETTFATRRFTKANQDRTILVVEDEEVLREFISSTLREQGFKVLQAGDGPEARLVWRTAPQPVDLLFTDMVMPNGVSGAQLANELIGESEKLKVLYTSGYSKEVVENAEHLIEGQNFLPKPFNAPKLIASIERCFRSENAVVLNRVLSKN